MKFEHRIIVNLIPPASSVLDLGCGNGDLIHLLVTEKQVRAQGIEIDDRAIYECVAKGLTVLHGDLDTGLVDFSDRCFDYVILDQTLQQLERPDEVLADALRVGKRVIVGFPNFAHYSARLQLLLRGRSPVTRFLPYEWHDTPNLRFFSTLDFVTYCRQKSIKLERAFYVSNDRLVRILPNLLADVGIFQIAS